MKKISLLLIALSFYSLSLQAQILTPSKVSFDDYEKLIAEVKEYRKTRLLSLVDFVAEGKKPDVIILDARSDAMYNAKHVKGAVHLNFSDFTQESLAKLIPSFDTKILIYCNNNFGEDRTYFPTKMVEPNIINISNPVGSITDGKTDNVQVWTKPITLALNIPTYTNLYGYGYRNVYELGEFVNIYDKRIEFEGTAVEKK